MSPDKWPAPEFDRHEARPLGGDRPFQNVRDKAYQHMDAVVRNLLRAYPPEDIGPEVREALCHDASVAAADQAEIIFQTLHSAQEEQRRVIRRKERRKEEAMIAKAMKAKAKRKKEKKR